MYVYCNVTKNALSLISMSSVLQFVLESLYQIQLILRNQKIH